MATCIIELAVVLRDINKVIWEKPCSIFRSQNANPPYSVGPNRAAGKLQLLPMLLEWKLRVVWDWMAPKFWPTFKLWGESEYPTFVDHELHVRLNIWVPVYGKGKILFVIRIGNRFDGTFQLFRIAEHEIVEFSLSTRLVHLTHLLCSSHSSGFSLIDTVLKRAFNSDFLRAWPKTLS